MASVFVGISFRWRRFSLASVFVGVGFRWRRFSLASVFVGVGFRWCRFSLASVFVGVGFRWRRFWLASVLVGVGFGWRRFWLTSGFVGVGFRRCWISSVSSNSYSIKRLIDRGLMLFACRPIWQGYHAVQLQGLIICGAVTAWCQSWIFLKRFKRFDLHGSPESR